MKFKFLWIGRTKDPFFSKIEQRYLKRIQRYFPAVQTIVRELNKSDVHQQDKQLQREARMIDNKISPGEYLIVLDDSGREFTSIALASFLRNLMDSGTSGITFIGGGYLGVPTQIKDSADLNISLTKLTLNHELSRIILLEQIYRSLSILKGFPYPK